MDSEPNDRAGRRERFMALLMPAYKRLEDFALAMTRNRDEARDLVAETLLRAYENFGKLKDERAFLGYLFSIAAREHRGRRRRQSRFIPIGEDAAETIRSAATAPDVAADVDLLYKALERLPYTQREAVVLFEISGFSIREIQSIQGGSVAAVKVRLFRARRRLGVLLGAGEFRQNGRRDMNQAADRSPREDGDGGITLRTAISE